MIERLLRLVSIRSLSKQEGEIADAITAEFHDLGLTVQRDGNNIWIEIGDRDRPRLLLNSHLDTVPPGDGWTGDPWTPRRLDDRIIALGANDAKGCLTAMIEAVLTINAELVRGKPLGGTVVLALTAEEEISGQGLSTILEKLKPLDAALVGEPTDLIPMTAQRGLLILRCVAHGRSSHPANTPPDTKANAIRIASADVVRLGEFDWGSAHPLLGSCHAHVTQITGGIARNVIPDRCEFTLDIRTTPSESSAVLIDRLRGFLDSEVNVHSDRLVPIETASHEPIVRAVLDVLPNTQPTGSKALSDMVFLKGIPAVKIGPGKSPRSHTVDEFIMLDELKNAAQVYPQIIRRYFQM